MMIETIILLRNNTYEWMNVTIIIILLSLFHFSLKCVLAQDFYNP